jgi:hypothetical protein
MYRKGTSKMPSTCLHKFVHRLLSLFGLRELINSPYQRSSLWIGGLALVELALK